MRVYVLIFNPGTDNEGIHTIQMGEQNKVLMFESVDDATRFALLLEAQDFPTASVESLTSEEIEEFCQSTGYEWELVKEGMLAIPPQHNLEELDWDTEEKPAATEPETAEISDTELETLRRRLEGLL
ncbi:MAG: hypothetical protein N5P05_001357 [Chroococcopsis gigantea SAG 12.99]|jgi:hypothetical protein|nr:DUF3110 domain-containing protein [Chlorogloea purpurea SAG 13.99]MDV2999751.1 hypothetical protein [Chroococcopsis gigantea SAG 12.99]